MEYKIIGLIVLFLVLGSLVDLFLPKIRGWTGEKAVAVVLAGLPKEEYIAIHDIMLNTGRGTTQIDHIVVSIYGIFVIETKNYKGWITGGDKSDQWVKNMYGKKYSFRNPVRQNFGHVKALENLLGLSENIFIPVVVFTPDADLKVKTKNNVIYSNRLKKFIRKFTEKKILKEELLIYADKIKSADVSSRENKKEHVNQIKNRIEAEKEQIKQGICPKCGGELVKRNGKYGKFIGCSNYPKCKFTK